MSPTALLHRGGGEEGVLRDFHLIGWATRDSGMLHWPLQHDFFNILFCSVCCSLQITKLIYSQHPLKLTLQK